MFVLSLALLSGLVTSDASAKHFVETLYAPYLNAKGTGTGYSPLQSRTEELDVFSIDIVRLLDADRSRTPKGFEGALESDPLCQCQDSDGMNVESVTQAAITKYRADIVVKLRFSNSPPKLTTLHLLLVREAHGWRVDDVLPSTGQSLRNALLPTKQK